MQLYKITEVKYHKITQEMFENDLNKTFKVPYMVEEIYLLMQNAGFSSSRIWGSNRFHGVHMKVIDADMPTRNM